MSGAETPRWPFATVCTFRECEEPARARVAWNEVKVGWSEQTTVTVTVRSLADPSASALRPYCLQHTHYWVDWALMSSLPAPCTTGGDS